jgi:hypothetical protein
MAMVVLFVAACSSPVSHLVLPGDEGITFGIPDVKANQPYTVTGLAICLDRPGAATILRVTPVNPVGGLRIDAFVATPDPFELGESVGGSWKQGTLHQAVAEGENINFARATTTVTHTCPPINERPNPHSTPRRIMLFLQYSKPTDTHASADETAIEYVSSGERFIAVVPYGVALCAAVDRTSDCGG